MRNLYKILNSIVSHYSFLHFLQYCRFNLLVMRLVLFLLILIWPFGAQGAKESSPTFSMTMVEEGQYAVDFHAQLSTLQAFSICVAILHGISAFSGAGDETSQPLSQCNSLKMLISTWSQPRRRPYARLRKEFLDPMWWIHPFLQLHEYKWKIHLVSILSYSFKAACRNSLYSWRWLEHQ